MKTATDTDVTYTVKRTQRRKTACVQIVSGEVTVVVPNIFSDAQVSRLVQSRFKQIQRTISEQSRAMRQSDSEFVSGHGFLYLGRTHRLKVHRSGSGTTGLRNGRLEVWSPADGNETSDGVRESMMNWYRTRAEEKFQERLKIYEKQIGVSVSFLSIKDMRTKWGSCTATGRVTLNWRLILAPTRIIDYVIVHELCHIVCHDHSRRFWSKVMRVIPDYEQRRDWLRNHGHTLTL